MNKRIFWKIGATISAAVVVLAALFMVSPPLPNHANNGFNRLWLPDAIQPIVEQRTHIPIENVCGATDHYIFISTNNPRCLVRQDYSLRKFDSIFFPVNATQTIMSNYQFRIDSPWTFLFMSNQPGIIAGVLRDSTVMEPVFVQTKQLFIQVAAISPGTAVIRTFDSLQSQQIFQKVSTLDGQISAEEVIFENQTDQGFSTAGMLQYDQTEKALVYVQSYQNSFITLDTNLKVLQRFHTIDTTFTNDMQVTAAKVGGVDKLVPSKARISANKNAYSADGLLYVLSGLRADNESLKKFNNNSVIDIYHIKSGKYIGSFYVPNADGARVRSFLVRKDKLITICKDHIAIYTLSLPSIT